MKHNNTYIFIYSTVMVLLVAAILSAISFNLKPFQDKNKEIEKKQDILKSVNIESSVENAESLYDQYVTASFITDAEGSMIDSIELINKWYTPFDIDLKKQYKKKKSERKLPLYKAAKNDSVFLVIPMRGAGLWGPIWGYISILEEKTENGIIYSKVYGATFDHEGETPGLGAEISTSIFQAQFNGKEIIDTNGKLVGIKVLKGGAKEGDLHGVDAITGGTITSNGVTSMIETCLDSYETFLKSQK